MNEYIDYALNDLDEAVKRIHKEKMAKDKEIERLHSIIKEVREYIEEHKEKGYRTPMSDEWEFWNQLDEDEIKELLEILDKVGDEK